MGLHFYLSRLSSSLFLFPGSLCLKMLLSMATYLPKHITWTYQFSTPSLILSNTFHNKLLQLVIKLVVRVGSLLKRLKCQLLIRWDLVQWVASLSLHLLWLLVPLSITVRPSSILTLATKFKEAKHKEIVILPLAVIISNSFTEFRKAVSLFLSLRKAIFRVT